MPDILKVNQLRWILFRTPKEPISLLIHSMLFRLLAHIVWMLLVFGYVLSSSAVAEETNTDPRPIDLYVSVGLFTRHISPGDDTNEKTKIILLSYDKFFITRFINSYNDETWSGGIVCRTRKRHLFENDGVFLQGNLYSGILYGYKDHLPNLGGVTPAVIPTVNIGYSRVSLELIYIPTVSGGVISSLIRFDLGWNRNGKQNRTEKAGDSIP